MGWLCSGEGKEGQHPIGRSAKKEKAEVPPGPPWSWEMSPQKHLYMEIDSDHLW